MHPNPFSATDQEIYIIEKIRTLPPDKVAEIVDFVDFISEKTQEDLLTKAACKLSEKTFGSVWSNPEDDAYDRL